jgi:small subunit ribosomal protein S20
LAHSSRTWRGARTPQAIKRVRQSERRHAILQPRRSAAKTLVSKTVTAAATGDAEQTRAALLDAVSALDKAAKVGAIHPNAAARRKSRLMLKVNAALGGEQLDGGTRTQRQTGKTAAAKAARARIAAGKASKAKGEQTAAGKARAALSRSTRESTGAAQPATETEQPATKSRTATGRAAGGSSKTTGTKASSGSAPKASETKKPRSTSK